MLKLLKGFVYVVVLFGLNTTAHAQLSWPTTVAQPEVSLVDKSVEAVFPFTNTGEDAIEISSVKSDCSCMVAKLDKQVYQPGESGEIKATFTFGAR